MKTETLTPLMALRPCAEAVKWIKRLPETETLQTAWLKCERGDWMLWLAGRVCGEVNTLGHRKMTAAKCRCARLVLHIFEDEFPGDLRPRRAIESAEAYAGGATYDRADAAYAANDAGAAHAADYADAANAAYAAYAAAAAHAADYAAADYAAAADAADSRAAMLARCADEVRKVYPVIPLE
jgi:hypothetical protein